MNIGVADLVTTIVLVFVGALVSFIALMLFKSIIKLLKKLKM